MQQVGEPSVEEILESIKKVIARDNRAEADQLRRRREHDGIVVTRPVRGAELAAIPFGPDDDLPTPVLELTEALAVPAADDFADNDDEDGFMADNETEALDDHGQAREETVSEIPEAPLVAETARASMRESLAALAMLSEPGAPPQIVRSGETSLEGLTRDLLRPMLAEWLDKNLPPMVDKLVATEISRIVGKRG